MAIVDRIRHWLQARKILRAKAQDVRSNAVRALAKGPGFESPGLVKALLCLRADGRPELLEVVQTLSETINYVREWIPVSALKALLGRTEESDLDVEVVSALIGIMTTNGPVRHWLAPSILESAQRTRSKSLVEPLLRFKESLEPEDCKQKEFGNDHWTLNLSVGIGLALVACGEDREGIAVLCECLSLPGTQWESEKVAVEALRESEPQIVEELVLKQRCNNRVLQVLEAVASDQSFDYLMSALRQGGGANPGDYRAGAARALARLGDRRAIPLLHESFSGNWDLPDARKCAAEALAALGHPDFAPQIGIKKGSPEHELFKMIEKGSAEAVRDLLQGSLSPDINVLAPEFGIQLDGTPLQAATRKGDKALISVLLEAGANVNLHGGQEWWTALHVAVIEEDLQTVELLLEFGADPNRTCRNRLTPLHFIFDRELPVVPVAILEAMVAAGARSDIATDNYYSWTPLTVLERAQNDVSRSGATERQEILDLLQSSAGAVNPKSR